MSQTISRVKSSINNIAFSFINYVVKLILSFAVRTIFIRVLSIEYLGVNSLFSTILNVLSLAELGVGTAIMFLLYKPVAEQDNEKISTIINTFRKLYLYVGIIVLIIGIAITPFINFFIKDAPSIPINLHLVFILFLINSAFSYFMSYRFVLFTAYQRKDAEYKINSVAVFVSTVIQVITLLIFRNYYIYLTISIFTGILTTFVTFLVSKKMFPDVNTINAKPLDQHSKSVLKNNVKGIFYHKISFVVITSASTLIISKFIGTQTLGVYSNYLLITVQLTSIFLLLCDSLRGSIGNLFATSELNNSLFNFKKLRLLFYWLSSFFSICMFVLFTPFLELWSRLSGWDATITYTFDLLTEFMIVLSFYIYSSRLIIGVFRECMGDFHRDRFKGIAEAFINITVSLVLVNFLGITGVLIGTIVGAIATSLWVDPYMVFKHYFKKSVIPHLLSVLLNLAITIIVGLVTWFVCSLLPSVGLWAFILKAGIIAVLPNLLFLLIYFKTPEFKGLVSMVKDMIKDFKEKRKQKTTQQ